MARDKGLEANMLDFFEERPADELQFSILLENSDIMARFREAFSSMIGQMDCIVVGRCGNVIFDHRSDLVSVFLKGDREQRIRNMAEAENISVREASELVRKMDDCRSSYHKYYTGHTWGAAQDYDLCVDSCRLGEKGTADIISLYVENQPDYEVPFPIPDNIGICISRRAVALFSAITHPCKYLWDCAALPRT